jgi:hypothetical protein
MRQEVKDLMRQWLPKANPQTSNFMRHVPYAQQN